MWLLSYICISKVRHLKTLTIQTEDFGLFLYLLHLTLQRNISRFLRRHKLALKSMKPREFSLNTQAALLTHI